MSNVDQITSSEIKTKNKKLLSRVGRKTFFAENTKNVLNLGKALDAHSRRNLDTTHVNYKIHHLLHDPLTITRAYFNISKNKEVLTKGFKDATDISEKLKKGQYKFKPVKRDWVSKFGKKRPTDVFTQSDLIVQEAIRGILEAIYEPEFEKWGNTTNHLSNNYGFRPSKSPWSALEKLKTLSQRCNTVIEGNIVSAYNNVDHIILINILQERIKDKKFIKLIKDLLKSGIMDLEVYEHNLKETPRVGIVSPLLFNIYLFDFDKFVYNEIILPLIENKHGKNYDERNLSKKIVNPPENQLKRFSSQRNKIQYNNVIQSESKAVYVRYVDDWVLTITGNKATAELIKNQISEFLSTKRKMQLNEEKTKIIHGSKGYKFLGFEVRMQIGKRKLQRVLKKNVVPFSMRSLKRTTLKSVTIEPDSDKILERLKLNSFCNSEYEPRAKPGWLVFEDQQIVEKYSRIFRRIFNYYLPCERLIRLNRISHILQYSCARTLARRRNTTLSKIFKKYGKNLQITTKTKTVMFLTLTDLRRTVSLKNTTTRFF